MNEKNLINYYNKFNEDKRLSHRHGIVEFNTTIKYIEEYLSKYKNPKIIDIGAGTGKYSIYLHNKGYDVTAVELVKHNLKTLQSKCNTIKSYQASAINLTKEKDNSYDLVLLFGPMYHLITKNEKIKALMEARRIVKDDGIIMISYYMNDYAIIKHGFMEKNIIDSINNNEINNEFKITPKEDDLYSMVTIDDINELNTLCNLKRIKIISQDGPSDYIRPYLNKLTDEEFEIYLKYILSICERKDLIGASSHTLDILKKI